MFWFTFPPPSLVRNKALYHWIHDDVIKWKHFPRYWPFVRGVHRWPVNSPHKGQWRTALIYFVCVWINDWINNRETGDLRRHRAHYDVIVLFIVWENAIATSYTLSNDDLLHWPLSVSPILNVLTNTSVSGRDRSRDILSGFKCFKCVYIYIYIHISISRYGNS